MASFQFKYVMHYVTGVDGGLTCLDFRLALCVMVLLVPSVPGSL